MAVGEQIVSFERNDRIAVVEAMRELDGRGDGQGWINISPDLASEDSIRVPERSGLAAWFSGRGPAVVMATWMPAATTGRPRPAQIGVEHGTGPSAMPRLAEQGVALPSSWTKRQDHAKHGIVAELPVDADPDAVLAWLLAAASVLTTIIDVGARWTAVVHRPT